MIAELWDETKKNLKFTDEEMQYFFGERGAPPTQEEIDEMNEMLDQCGEGPAPRTDFIGQELALGDVVIYTLASSGRSMYIGRIQKFTPKMISVSRIGHSSGTSDKNIRISRYKKNDSIYSHEACKINNQYVTLLLLSLKGQMK